MDETFAFIAPVMPRRTVHPMALRAAVIAAMFVAAMGALGLYVVEHEQAADARRDALAAKIVAAEEARVAKVSENAYVPVGMEGTVDQTAGDALDEALGYAQATLVAGGSLSNAGPGELSAIGKGSGSGLLFVDGPSTMPSIVSVAVAEGTWAAAVASSDGCLWINLGQDGQIARQAGGECTGAAALAATGTTW